MSRAAAGALLFSLLPGLSWGADDDLRVTFQGRPATRRVEIPAATPPGAVVFESGPSDPLAGPFDGILFQGKGGPGLRFEAAIDGGNAWGPWVEAQTETFPNGRFWGSWPLAGKTGTRVRMRIVVTGPTGREIAMYEIEAHRVEAEEAGARTGAAPIPAPGAPKPEVVSRDGWGAAPPRAPFDPMAPERLTVHHTAGAQPMTESDAVTEMRLIQRYHQNGRQWNDIGYHFVIDGAGRVFQGRPENVVGAHVLNRNTGNVGISLMGNFHDPAQDQPTAAQIDSLKLLGRWLVAAYAIDPRTLSGHRDFQSTDCPGERVYVLLEDIRRSIGAQGAVAQRRLAPRIAAGLRLQFIGSAGVLP